MIGASGRNIPDPPSDPEQKRLWKTIYYAEIYGASPERIREIMMETTQQESRVHRYTPRPPTRPEVFVARLFILMLVVAALILLFVR
jgi:hypothetical protein